jgi:post-segregation antitoxin (ccd killing protein)
MEDVMPDGSRPRRPTNVTLPEALIAQAKELKINISQACALDLLLTGF